MAPPGARLFGGFDLKNANSLRRLAIALEYRLAGGREQSNAALSSLSPWQQASVETATERMQNSPLLTEIITSFLNTPRAGNANLLAAGRDLEAYAISKTYNPNSHVYADALAAWENRQPLAFSGNDDASHGKALTGATTSTGKQGTVRAPRSDRGQKARDAVDNDVGDEEQETLGSRTQQGQGQKKKEQNKKQTAPKEEEVSKPKNKRKKNPLLAQAAAELSQTYQPPTQGRGEARSTLSERSRSHREITDPQVELSQEKMAQIQRDEEAARHLANSEAPSRGGLRSRGQPTLQERLRTEQEATEKLERKITSRRNRSSTPPPRTQFQSAEEEAQERLDADLARQAQHEEDLNAGLRSRRAGDDDLNSQSPRKTLGSGSSATGKVKGKNAPKKRAGDRPLLRGVDREGATVGVVDCSKMTISFDTERDDSKHKGRVIPGDRVNYDYLENHEEPDWHSIEDIRALNTWRRQIFGRNFPPIRKTREFWLESEKKTVLDLMRKQLEYSRYIKWNRVANEYNKKMAGVIQKQGEEMCKQGIRKSKGLIEDRSAPWRTMSAIQGQTIRWEEYSELLESFLTQGEDTNEDESGQEDADPISDSEDEREIPDPNPGPRSEPLKRKHTKTKTATSTNTTKKTAKALRSRGQKRKKQESDGEEEGSDVEMEDEDEAEVEEPLPPSKKGRTGRKRGEKDDEEEPPFFPNLFKK